MIKTESNEKLMIHRLSPQVVSSHYTKRRSIFGIVFHTKISNVDSTYDENIFKGSSLEVTKGGIGFKKSK